MKKLLKWFLRLSVMIVVLASLLFVHIWYFKPYKIDWFYGRVFAKFALNSPEMLSNMRILPSWLDFYSDDFDDASPVQEDKLAEVVKQNHDSLKRYDRSALNHEEQLSYDVLEYFLRVQVEGDRFRFYDFPVNQMSGVQSSLPNFMVQVHQVNNQKDAENYITRLEKFPQKFSQVLEGLKVRENKGIIPPQFTVEKVLTQMEGFIAVPAQENVLYTSFKEKLDKLSTEKIDQVTREQLLTRVDSAIKNHVYSAYHEMIGYFSVLKTQGNFGAWHLPNGDAYYAWCVKSHTSTEMTPEQLHQVGLAEVARISTEMDAILKAHNLTDGNIGERVQQLSQDPEQLYPNTPEGKAAIIQEYQTILDEVNNGLDGTFNVRPKLGIEVKPVPEFSQATAPGAYYEPGTFDGSRPGVFYANMRDTAESPKFGLRTLAYHEGIPGHHFQISIAQELKGVPFFRRVLPFTAYVEGWALYAEQLAWELGFEKNPLDNLGRLQAEMMRAVRLVVDTGIHYKHWTHEQSIAYMIENTGMAESDVISEIERYFVNPGQALAYKTGMLKILELREKAKQALGAKFKLSDFHDQVLTHGALPLALLEREIDTWIAKVQTN